MKNLLIQPPVIAHRGVSGYAPENTIIAFTKAAQLGLKWVEFDVTQAACGEPILFHDELLDRTTNGKGEVHLLPYAHLRTLDAGAWYDARFSGEKIPTLIQTLECLTHFHLSANIEIKALPEFEEKLITRVLQIVKGYPRLQILFSSFSWSALRFIRQIAPQALIGVLLHEWEAGWENVCAEVNCISVHVNEEIMTKEMAEKIKAMGKLLFCYTVNDVERAEKLYAWGVDAIFSDVLTGIPSRQ